MARSHFKLVGTEQVKRNFLALTEGMNPAAARVLKEVAEDVKTEAKELVPVDTGALRDSIRVIVTAKTAGNITRVGVRAGGYEVNPKTGKLVDYAVPVEFGTSRQMPQPYLIPAASKKAVTIMRRLLKELIILPRRYV